MATYQDKLRTTNASGLCVATPVGATGGNAVDAWRRVATANAADANVITETNAAFGQATAITLPDPGAATASYVLSVSGPLLSVSVTLSTAQVVAAYAAPVALIAAPGAGKAIVIQEATVYTASTGNTAYATGTAPVIQYDTTVHGAGTVATASGLVAGDITASASQIRSVGPSAAALTGITNKSVCFSNATGAYTNGTGTNVTFNITYLVINATV